MPPGVFELQRSSFLPGEFDLCYYEYRPDQVKLYFRLTHCPVTVQAYLLLHTSALLVREILVKIEVLPGLLSPRPALYDKQ